MKYDDNNIFAKILKGEIPCKKIYEDEFVLSFHDINPQKKIHALVIPKGKYIDLDDFSSKAKPEEMVGLLKGINIVAKKLGISTDAGKGYRALANISEDAWFGNSLAPWQRLQIARMRALEVRRPIIRSSNNGLSALINHFGKVIEVAPMFESVVLRGEVQPMTGTTPFVRFGNLPLFFVLGLGLIACLWMIRVLRKGRVISNRLR